jgi:hypothetical protein
VSNLSQLATLLARYADTIRGDWRNLGLLLGQAPAIGLLVAIIFASDLFASPQTRSADGSVPIQDAPLVLFLLAFGMVCFGMCNSAREIAKERTIYRRERHVTLRLGPYVLSKVLLLSLLCALQSLVLLGLVRLKMDFQVDAGGLALMGLTMFLGTLGAMLLGLLLSALATTTDQAITLVAVFLLQQVIFSGLIRLEKLNESIRWVASLTLTRWSYGGLCRITDLPHRWREVGLGSQVHDVLETDPGTAWLWLAGLALVYLGGTLLVLRWKDGRDE